eukprot:TRINITY_DN720_c0_g1_i1.p1 TRINITY_DN720_c0_g1~~TRINITY_DN720_c0_g1_i1.p1  ORF type:complete len:189 (+),score=38.22 TRINITY_DN720_c0_g1_i1:1140-1706(+)
MQLFLQSDRSAKDCRREIERGDEYNMNVIIRNWVAIPIDYEFRCFFTKKKINAISQYFNNCYFQSVVENKELLERLMLEKWEEVKDKIPFEEGIVDFVVDLDERKTYIIEFNPLDQFTGSAMFDYFADWDVVTGNAPREFRIIDSREYPTLKNEWEGMFSSFGEEIHKAELRQNEKSRQEQKESCSMM